MPTFVLSPKQWIEKTNAIGITSKSGRYGGTYAHRDIAFEFGAAISPTFKLYLIKEYQRFKAIESNQYNIEWNVKRILSKANYHLHTDAVKNYILPQKNYTKNTEWLSYAEEADLLNVALFKCTAKDLREANPELAKKGMNIRDIASINELAILSNIESMNAEMIRKGIPKSKQQYKKIEKQLKESGEKQISTSDPDSRHMITRNNITEVAYNIQSTVDEKFKIPIDYKVTNQNDKKAMGNMLQRAEAIMGHNNFTALYDKGYHTGSEFDIAHKLNIKVLVAIPKVPANAPNPLYNVENFEYDKDNDYYICPQGEKLTTNGKWHQAKHTDLKDIPLKPAKLVLSKKYVVKLNTEKQYNVVNIRN